MNSEIKRSNLALCLELARSVREGGGTPVEADEDLNNASRALILAVNGEYGAAWIGKINAGAVPHIVLWNGCPVENFGADFVLPRHDLKLEELLLERDAAPWTAKQDVERIQEITERVRAIGGLMLVWS